MHQTSFVSTHSHESIGIAIATDHNWFIFIFFLWLRKTISSICGIFPFDLKCLEIYDMCLHFWFFSVYYTFSISIYLFIKIEIVFVSCFRVCRIEIGYEACKLDLPVPFFSLPCFVFIILLGML